MSCARTGPSPCWGYGYFDVSGGEWDAGRYLVRAGSRYADTEGYVPDSGFGVDGYDNDTGAVDFEYSGRRKPYGFYGSFLWDFFGGASVACLVLTIVGKQLAVFSRPLRTMSRTATCTSSMPTSPCHLSARMFACRCGSR